MTDTPAIAGTLDSYKTMRTTGCVRIVIDVPAYEATKIVGLFGVPQPGESVAVAIARINPETEGG